MMKKELENYLKKIAIDQLMKSPVGDKLQQAMKIFEEVQNHLYALSEKKGEERTTTVKVVTITTFALLKKFSEGKKAADLTQDDWKDIAKAVSECAILQENQKYVKSVFGLYERYIRFSAELVKEIATEDAVASIQGLADALLENAEKLDCGHITEVEYTESCLWISLEAMIKLLAAMVFVIPDSDYASFAHALAIYAFEYGRFILHKQEQELLEEFVQSQHELDVELEQKYTSFIKALEEQSEHFYVLVENAFVSDFREAFLSSAVLARTAGVEEKEILVTDEDIDAFFMD